VLINVHLLVNVLCEYQNVRCNDKKELSHIYLFAEDLIRVLVAQTTLYQMVGEWWHGKDVERSRKA